MTVITFPRHKYKNCDGSCLEPYFCKRCPICEWGTALCTTCGGAEGELTHDCPQRQTTKEERSAIQGGQLEYTQRKGWFNPQPRCVSV